MAESRLEIKRCQGFKSLVSYEESCDNSNDFVFNTAKLSYNEIDYKELFRFFSNWEDV